MLLAAGAWQGVTALASPEGEARLRPALDLPAFLSGRLTGAVNHVMAHELPADPCCGRPAACFATTSSAPAGPQVRVGCDGTLFLTEELRPWPDAAAAMASAPRASGACATRSTGSGVALVVAVVPDKARVVAAKLCGAPRSAQAAARHDAFLAALRAAGVEPVALLPALAAAEAAGRRLVPDRHALEPGGGAGRGRGDRRGRRRPAPDPRRALPHPGRRGGDGGAGRPAPPHRPGPGAGRAAPKRRTASAWSGRRREESGTGGLLDEPPPPEVALVGSSYSVNANFHGALQAALQASVVNAALAGGGFAGSAAAYLGGETFRQSPPRLVVWEIPERVVGATAHPGRAGVHRPLAARRGRGEPQFICAKSREMIKK